MNKKTKLLSIFILAGVISSGVAVGVTGCKKHSHNWSDTYSVQENGKHAKTCDGCDKLSDEHDAKWTDENDTTCDHDGCTVTRTVTSVTGVTVSAAGNATSVVVDGTLQLTATVTGTGDYVQTVTWSTTSDKIELNTSTGLVTGKTATTGDEKVTIRATSTADPTKYGEIQITVTPKTPGATVTVDSVSITEKGTLTSIEVDETKTLHATVTGTGNPAQTVTWSTTSDKVQLNATTGVVTGKTATTGNEKVTIRATSTEDPTKYDEIEITITPKAPTAKVTGVSINEKSTVTSIMERDVLPLHVTVTGEGDYSSEVEWESSDPTKATVDATGKVTGVAACDAVTITVKSKADPSVTDSITFAVTAFVDEHAGTKYAEIRDKSNNIIAEDFKHTTKADIPAYSGSLGGTPAIYYHDEVGARFDVIGGALVIGDGKKDDSKKNVSAIVDFGLVDGIVEGYFTYKFDTEASGGGNKIHFLDADGNKVLEMIAYGNSSGKHFQFKLNGEIDPTKESGSGAITAAKDTLYKIYFKIDLDDDGKLTLKIDETTVYDNVPTGIDSVAGLQFETSDSGARKSTIDNIAIAADQMTAAEAAAKLKTKLLAYLEDEYESYDLTTDYTKNGSLVTAAYNKGVNDLSAEGATIEQLKTAYKTAVEAMDDVLSDADMEPDFAHGSSLAMQVLMYIGESLGNNISIEEDIVIDGTTIKGNVMQAYEIISPGGFPTGFFEMFEYDADTTDFTGKIRTKSELEAWAEKVAADLAAANIPTDAEIIDAVKDAVNAHIDKLINAAKAENSDAADALEALRTTLKGNVTEAADEYDADEYNAEEVVTALKEIDEGIAAAIQQAIEDSSKTLQDLQQEYNAALDAHAAKILEDEAEELGLPSAPDGLVAAVNAVRDEWKGTINAVTDEEKNTIPGLADDGKDAMDAALEEYKNRTFEISIKIGGDITVSDSAKVYNIISKRYGYELQLSDIKINGFYVTGATVNGTPLTFGTGPEDLPTTVPVYGAMEVTVTAMDFNDYDKKVNWSAPTAPDGTTPDGDGFYAAESELVFASSLVMAHYNKPFDDSDKGYYRNADTTPATGKTYATAWRSGNIAGSLSEEEGREYNLNFMAQAKLSKLTIKFGVSDSKFTSNRGGKLVILKNGEETTIDMPSNSKYYSEYELTDLNAYDTITIYTYNLSNGSRIWLFGVDAEIDEETIPETVKVHWGTDVQEHWYRHGDQITAPNPTEDDLDGKEFDYWKFTCNEEEGHHHGDRWVDGDKLTPGEHTLIAETREAEPVTSITIVGASAIGVGNGSSITLTIDYNGGDGVDSLVAWSITDGGDKATIAGGVLTLNDTAAAGDTITVKAVYNSEDGISDTKVISVLPSSETFVADSLTKETVYDTEDNTSIYTGELFDMDAATTLTVYQVDNQSAWASDTNTGLLSSMSKTSLNLGTAGINNDVSSDLVTITANADIKITLYSYGADADSVYSNNARVFTIKCTGQGSIGTTSSTKRTIAATTVVTIQKGTTVTISVTNNSGSDNRAFYLFGVKAELAND